MVEEDERELARRLEPLRLEIWPVFSEAGFSAPLLDGDGGGGGQCADRREARALPAGRAGSAGDDQGAVPEELAGAWGDVLCRAGMCAEREGASRGRAEGRGGEGVPVVRVAGRCG